MLNAHKLLRPFNFHDVNKRSYATILAAAPDSFNPDPRFPSIAPRLVCHTSVAVAVWLYALRRGCAV